MTNAEAVQKVEAAVDDETGVPAGKYMIVETRVAVPVTP